MPRVPRKPVTAEERLAKRRAQGHREGTYGASLLAHLAVARCADHLPLYRLEKDFARRRFPLARSTMNDLLHRTSERTQPLWQRLLDQIRTRPIVGADETRLVMQKDGTGKPKNG